MARPLVKPIFRDQFFSFSAGMATDIRSKKPVPAKPWKKLISAEKSCLPTFRKGAMQLTVLGGGLAERHPVQFLAVTH